jgi:ribosomal protein S3
VIRESIEEFKRDNNLDDEIQIIFYADDGVIIGTNATKVQEMLNIFTRNFAIIGLMMNVEKIKAMIMNGGKMSQKLSNKVYNWMITKTGLTFQEQRKE